MIQEQDSQQSEQPVTVVDADGDVLSANEAAEELYQYDEDELIGMNAKEIACEREFDAARNFERTVCNEETTECTLRVRRSNGVALQVTQRATPYRTGDGELRIEITTLEAEPIESEQPSLSDDGFDDIDPMRVNEIAENVRVDVPEGEMTLDAIMLDIAVGHNDVEKYKKGAYSLYKALDMRLQQEKERNPDSDTVRVIEETKKSAFGLYLRIERGDAELHGKEDGEYSGYYDNVKN